MLALPPQQPPPPDLSTRTMSLAVLPSAAPSTAYNNAFPNPPSKRPKLSLNTSSVAPTAFGKKATSLRLETLSATSPTARNTFSNAHEPKRSRLCLTPLATQLSASPDSTTTPDAIDRPNEEESATPASSGSVDSISTIDSLSTDIPYKVPFNCQSILKNGPLSRGPTTQTTTFAPSKLMFPAAKKVAFREPLTEEVRNEKFTFKHSDIESSNSTISTLDLNDTVEDVEVKRDEDQPKKTDVKDESVSSPHTGDKRESSDEENDDDETANGNGDSYPTTPVAGRRKRHRQWVWTLPPVKDADAVVKTDAQVDDAQDTSEHKSEGS